MSEPRIYRIVEGKYAGDYPCFWNAEECRKYHEDKSIDIEIRVWDNGSDPFKWQIGDYVQALDGFVVPIIKTRELTYRGKYKNVAITFPNGTFICKRRQDGSIRYPRFYAQFTNGARHQAGYGLANDSLKKVKFATLLLQGMNPYKALREAFGYKNSMTMMQMRNKIVRLMMDETVVRSVREQISPFLNEIEQEFSDEWIIKEMKDYFAECKRGSADHRLGIQMVMEIRKLTPEKPKKGRALEEAQYEELEENGPPPLLD
jgi:hypothetical protein